MTLDYDNRTGRPVGRVTTALGLVVPGVRRVRARAEEYADTWHARNLRTLAGTGPRWVVLGDSMSQSVGASSVDAGWVGQVAARLGAACPTILNLSATGARTADVLTQQLGVLARLDARDPAHDPAHDLVTVMVGSNDLFAGAQVRSALAGTFARLLDELPDGAVVTTLPQPARAAQEVNRLVEAARDAGRVHVVDMRTDGPDSWSGKLAADFFHPNDAGYTGIADAFEPVVRRVLGA